MFRKQIQKLESLLTLTIGKIPLTQVSSRAIEDTLRYVLGANGSSDYTFTGPGLSGAVNDPTLTLSRGHTYIFENRSGGHPFYIKTSIANGGTNDAYNTGVTNNGGGNGTEIVFTVPHDAPDTLYYQCSSHSSMAGQLSISGSVADGSITESKLADDAVTADKLANSINSAIAANTAKDLTALSASNLTSGTVPDARFPATLPAASAANLTNVPAANLTGALPAISGASLTNIDGGKILQVVSTTYTGTTTVDGVNQNAGVLLTGMRRTIQPTAASSKILIAVDVNFTASQANFTSWINLRIGGSVITGTQGTGMTSNQNASFKSQRVSGSDVPEVMFGTYLDTPSYTLGDTLTYDVYFHQEGGSTAYINYMGSNANVAYYTRFVSTQTLFEVAA